MASTERDNAGLEADIGITVNKLTKQLALAESRFIKMAKKFETDFANSNREVTRSFDKMGKSAQGSALAMGKEMDRLRAKFDPIFAASRRYEMELEELNRAHKVGAINVQQYERALETLNAEYTRAANGTRALDGAMASAVKGSRVSGHVIQNTAFQVGDFAVQVGAGTSAAQALGQQFPQLLGGFGVMGAVLGAVVAAGVPLARMLLDTGDAGAELEEKLEALEQAVSDYSSAVSAALIPTEELKEKYGAATEAAQAFIGALAQINERAATDALSSSLQDIAMQFGGLSDTLINVGGVFPLQEIQITAKEIAKQLEITEEAALSLAEGLKVVSDADGPEIQARAAEDLLDFMVRTLGPIEQMSDGARNLAEMLATAGLNASEVTANIEKTNFGIQDMISGLQAASGNLSAMVTDAGSLGDNMLRAAGAAWSFLQARARERAAYNSTVGRGRGADPRQFGGSAADVQKNVPAAQLAASEMAIAEANRKAAEKAAKGGRKSRGGGSGGKQETSLFEVGERSIQNLERQIEMIGKSRSAVAELTAKYRLLDEAKKRGIDLDSKQAGSSRTVREQIDEQAAAVGRLTQRADEYKERAQFMDGLNQDLKDGFIDAIIEGENFGDVLENVAKQLAKAALQAALFGSGPFAGGGGGGGGLFGKLFPLLLGGGKAKSYDGGGFTGLGSRSGGIDGRGGFPAILHPNETVVDHTKGQQASRGETVVRVDLSPELVGQVVATADRNARVMVTASAQAQSRGLNGAMQGAQARGTTG